MRFNYSIILLVILFNTIHSIELELVAKGFKKPIHICNDNKSNDLYIVEQRGKIIKLKENNQKSVFLDITDRVKGPSFFGDERGLLGLAFHPNYKNNGYFFINYIDHNNNTVISKCYFNNNKDFKETIIMYIKQPYQNHNGGHLEFGPDGHLYIATGDGGSSGDPEGNAQNLSSLLGKILRLDINEKLYKVPEDNPFIAQNDARGEIWAYGLRNPWKFSFNYLDSIIFIADVGQNSWEELNIQYLKSSGLNYGWNIKEGMEIYKDNNTEINLIDPIIQYSSNASYGKTLAGLKQSIDAIGCSITGGYIYDGEIEIIKGQYFFADYCTGKVWSIKNYMSPEFEIIDWTTELVGNKKQLYISSFGKDLLGNLYIADHNGSIYKITE